MPRTDQPLDPASGNVDRRLPEVPPGPQPVASKRCTAVRPDGSRCRGTASTRSSYAFCVWHDPEIADSTKAAWRLSGGTPPADASTPNPRLSSPAAVTKWAEQVSGKLLRGEVTAAQATVLSSLAKLALSSYDSDLVRRIEDLEQAFADRNGSTPGLKLIGGPLAALPAHDEDDPHG